jgi:hypothetical protein
MANIPETVCVDWRLPDSNRKIDPIGSKNHVPFTAERSQIPATKTGKEPGHSHFRTSEPLTFLRHVIVPTGMDSVQLVWCFCNSSSLASVTFDAQALSILFLVPLDYRLSDAIRDD